MTDELGSAPVSNNESNSGATAQVESNQSSVQTAGVATPVTEVSSTTPVPNQTSEQTQQKRLYEREEVNRIASHAAREAEAKAEARYKAEIERSKQYSTPQSFQPQQQQQAQQGQPSIEVTKQHIQQIAFEERMAMESDSLRNKIMSAQEKYTDFATVTDVLDDIVTTATAPVFNGLDNAADVIYELGKHPERIPPQLFELARDPYNVNNALRARRALDAIGSQLKANEAARSQPLPKDPVQHEKPTTAAMDNGKVTVSDLRKMKQYRA